VRVWDDAFEARFADVAAKVTTFEAVVDAEEPDLILGGVQAADTGFGATGVALAERIGFEHAAVVNDLEVDADAGVAHVHRELEGGIEELTDVDLPRRVDRPDRTQRAALREPPGIRQAQRKEIDAKDLADLGLSADDVESALAITSMYDEPESESNAEIIDGDAGRARRALPRSSARRG